LGPQRQSRVTPQGVPKRGIPLPSRPAKPGRSPSQTEPRRARVTEVPEKFKKKRYLLKEIPKEYDN